MKLFLLRIYSLLPFLVDVRQLVVQAFLNVLYRMLVYYKTGWTVLLSGWLVVKAERELFQGRVVVRLVLSDHRQT